MAKQEKKEATLIGWDELRVVGSKLPKKLAKELRKLEEDAIRAAIESDRAALRSEEGFALLHEVCTPEQTTS